MMINTERKVAVLTGGIGTERDVSIQSGKCVSDALKKAGFKVVTADIKPDKLDILQDSNIDIFFIALHGKFGEDGQLTQILEDKSLLYTGSGPKASRLAFDKLASKKDFEKNGVVTPKSITFDEQADSEQPEKKLSRLGRKFFFKH